MIRRVRLAPDPVLRAVAAPVERFDDDLRALAADMLETLYAAPGRGLAAPQVGEGVRLFVMDVGWREGASEPRVFVNPELLAASEETALREEGCLSIPGRTSRVRRPERVTLQWRELDGSVSAGAFAGFAATCVQHEMDHLDGVLCIDREEPEGVA